MSLNRWKRAAFAALALCLLSAMVSGMAVTASAAGGTELLPPGLLIGDQDGISVDAHGYYYLDVRGLMPGDVVRKTVTIQNLSHGDPGPEGKLPYSLSMTSEPLLSTGPVDLLDKVNLTLKLDGRVVYDGRVRGDGTPNMIEKALPLGLYALGARKTLEITLRAAPDMQVYEEKSEADFRWRFYALRAAESEPPKTGIADSRYLLLLPVGCALGFFAILLLLKKRREEHA